MGVGMIYLCVVDPKVDSIFNFFKAEITSSKKVTATTLHRKQKKCNFFLKGGGVNPIPTSAGLPLKESCLADLGNGNNETF